MRDCFLDVAEVRLPICLCLNEDSGTMNERFTGNDEKAVAIIDKPPLHIYLIHEPQIQRGIRMTSPDELMRHHEFVYIRMLPSSLIGESLKNKRQRT